VLHRNRRCGIFYAFFSTLVIDFPDKKRMCMCEKNDEKITLQRNINKAISKGYACVSWYNEAVQSTKEMNMKLFNIVAVVLVLLGGLNWTLVGLVGVNLFTMIFGETVLTTLVYLLVTVSTLYVVLPRLTTTTTS
jgi:uncharacterized membrane protein YuzA (DUF378 family)